MLTTGDALTKTLAKSQKVTFWSQKNSFRCFFFLLTAGDALRATPAISQNHEQKPFLDAKGEKRCSSNGAIAGVKIWLLNSDKPNLVKYS